MNDLDILNPIAEAKIGDETVIIRELAWPDAMVFLKKLAERAGQFTTTDGKLSVSPDKLAEIITGAQDLSEWLITKSAVKDVAWLQQRTFSEALDLIEACLSMNVRPDFFSRIKRIGTRLIGAVTTKAASETPSTSSSGKATPART